MTIAIIVTFCPDENKIYRCIESLLSQVDFIVIVKNSRENLYFSSSRIYQIQLSNNLGIAYAQNIGIKYAADIGASFILFSDQDTIFPLNYVSLCHQAFIENSKKYQVSSIVPLFWNENKQQYSKLMIKINKAIVPILGKTYLLSHAISSGSFSSVDVFSTIGFFNERMFIDFVDNEWFWRANKKGYKIICDTNIVISHSMGDSFKVIFGKKIVVYKNIRHYYFFRNGFYLLFHSKSLSFTEKINFLNFLFFKIFAFLVTQGLSIKNIKLLLKAIYKGIFNNFSLEESIQ